MKLGHQNSGRCRAGGRYSEVVVSSGLTVLISFNSRESSVIIGLYVIFGLGKNNWLWSITT